MPKITFIGAGSCIFTKNLLGDIFQFPELKRSRIALMDIDAERLKVAEALAHKVAEQLDTEPAIVATTDRKKALEGADYVVNTIQVGGYEPCTVTDFEIPKKYGLKQTIADTLGIGGIMRGLRAIPVMVGMCREMEDLCPDAWLLNYTNPMAINTGALLQQANVKAVGLCHGIQSSHHHLANCLGIPHDELAFVAAGTNHCAWFLKLEHNGEDMYPALKRKLRDGKERWTKTDKVRFEMMMRFGYYGGESSEHMAEYVPYFIRKNNPELIDRFDVPIDEYIRRCISQNQTWDEMARKLVDRDEPLGEIKRSSEYGSLIIHSIETGTPRVVYGNILNNGHITNLPNRACVEVPCLVDRNGIQGTVVGEIPAQCAAVTMTNINVHLLTQKASVTHKKEDIYRAAYLDPLTSTNLTMDEIVSMVDDLIEAHGDYLPKFE
ncbi:MAG: alpha-glucosidase/alpha-galactosidase [Armatimonadetes bacterium RBG_16_58_9]|nr:MAG: alpha-glucosidase/alpha-galactosidase [Armatimonadetes bacterium RBG_16_58_9]